MNDKKDIKQIGKEKVEVVGVQPPQLLPPMQFSPTWSEINYGAIRIASSYEDLQTMVSWLKYLIDLEKKRRPGYLG